MYRVVSKLELVHVHDTSITEAEFFVGAFKDLDAIGVESPVRCFALGNENKSRKVEFRAAVRNRAYTIAFTRGNRFFVAD